MPQWAEDAFAKAVADGPEAEHRLATELCVDLCGKLIDGGVERLHFYTLNRPEMTRDVCTALGVAPCATLGAVA